MKLELTTYDIADRLLADDNANWSRAGALALAEWLEEMEESTGESMELDVVAIRCDFAQWKNLKEWAHDYFTDDEARRDAIGIEGQEADDDMTQEELDELTREYIFDNGWLIEFDGGVIVSSF